MPGQSRQQTATSVSVGAPQAPAQTAPTAQDTRGNAALQEQLRAKQSPGKLSWQSALGDSLGGKLYDALSAQLSDEKLLAQAEGAVASATNALKAQLDGSVPLSDKAAAELFVAHLDTTLKALAQKAVVQSGLSDGIRDAVDAHPYEIALAALAGAVAYVLSNQDLPVLEAKLGLGGGHSLVGGVDPGRTMSFAVEQIRLGYRYDGDRVAARLDVDRFRDGYEVGGKVTYTPNPDTEMALAGSHSDRGGVQRSKLDATFINRDLAATLGIERNVGGDTPGQSIGGSLSSRGGPNELNRSLSGKWRSDGSWEGAAGVGRSDKDSAWSVEAYGGRDAKGNEDLGVRALFKLQF
ncbi:MAG: hypothetical protein ACK4YP_08850 [Myxococcota bacterium]